MDRRKRRREIDGSRNTAIVMAQVTREELVQEKWQKLQEENGEASKHQCRQGWSGVLLEHVREFYNFQSIPSTTPKLLSP